MVWRASIMLIIVSISTNASTLTTPPPSSSPGCQEGHQLGYHSCSFICGLNDQWYAQAAGGGNIPGAPRCQNKGDVVEAQCAQICVNGEYLPTPCYYCCQDYSNNHCDITCEFGLYVQEGCDPFIPPTTPARPPTTPPATRLPGCQEGDSIGYHSCSFICGLNDQWYPETYSGGSIPPGAAHCGNKGDFIEAHCPLICVQGEYQPAPCYRCCQDYSSNHCDITCDLGLIIQEGCDPFIQPTTTPRPPTMSPPTTSPGCQEGHQLGYHSCSFICGLNDQWYPQSDGGGNIPGAPRCENKGDFVEAQCAQICVNGQYLPTPCYYCCQDYSNNHCDITCDFGLYVQEGCDPFIPPTAPARPPTTPPATRLPGCQEGDSIGYHSCSFICGLNDQWYPETYSGGSIPPGAAHCGNEGDFIEAQCPSICVQREYQPAPCYRCCQDYSNNHCDITCDLGLNIKEGCDPFIPHTTQPRSPTMSPSTTSPDCQEGHQLGYHSCSFICGLNDQWYPQTDGGGNIPGASRCQNKGEVEGVKCLQICVNGEYVPTPCYYCCQDYSNNHCDITCDFGLHVEDGCDPFIPPTTPARPPTTPPPTPSPGCQEGDSIGYHSCSFICGLNDQWYPQPDGGGNIPGAPRCENKGDFVEAQCAQICVNGQYLPTPCYYCCQDYSNNHCDITCDFGLYVPDGCDPFIPPTTPARPPTTPPATPSPGCQEGDYIGYHSCSFICGLNDQWYPETYSGGSIPPGVPHCGNKGDFIEAQCPLICVQGEYQPAPCYRCCQDYSSNHCDITCDLGLIVQDGCDPFNETDPLICNEGDQIGHQYCSFICGLEDQWFPEGSNGQPIFGTEACSVNGTLVESQCPMVCSQGQFVQSSCEKCCQNYSANFCNNTCQEGVLDFGDCDPFSHSATLKIGALSFLFFPAFLYMFFLEQMNTRL